MDRKDIFVIQGNQYKEMAVRVLEAARVAEDIGDRGRCVGLKPNLVVARDASGGATTHPELVDGALTYLKNHGFHQLVVLEGSWVGDRTSEAVIASGIDAVCKKHGVPFIDTQKDRFRECNGAGMKLKVCEQALAVDYLINMPVLKGHCQTIITCALKNSKGLIPDSEKRRFHTMGLHKPIAHLNTIIHQDFVLVDNICGDLDFEEGGNPVVMDRVLGFKDPVLCDSYAAESMGYRPEDIEYIRLAAELGVGSMDTASAKVISLNAGTDGQMGKKAIKPAKNTRRVAGLAGYASPEDACSACYGSLIYALDRLNEAGLLKSKEKGTLAIGQGYRGKSGDIGIGQCTACFEKSLGGCPPKAVDIVQFLKENW